MFNVYSNKKNKKMGAKYIVPPFFNLHTPKTTAQEYRHHKYTKEKTAIKNAAPDCLPDKIIVQRSIKYQNK